MCLLLLQVTPGGRTVTVYYNHNMREWCWAAPFSTPLPSMPGDELLKRTTCDRSTACAPC